MSRRKRNTIAITASTTGGDAHAQTRQHSSTASTTPSSPKRGTLASSNISQRPPRTYAQWEDPVVGFDDKPLQLSPHKITHEHAVDHASGMHHDDKDAHLDEPMWPPDFETLATGHWYGEMIESKYVEGICQRLRMSKRDIWKMRKQFNGIDVDNTNTITMAEFFFQMQVEHCGLSKAILRLADVSPDKTRLTFDEYLCCVCQLASFSESELLRYMFSLYTTDKKRGVMVEQDVAALTQALMSTHSSYKGNVRQASQRFTLATGVRSKSKLGEETMYTLDDFQALVSHNRVAFYPLLSLQRSVRRATLGERYWATKVEDNERIEAFVRYMRKHHGILPPLTWRERVTAAVCWPRQKRAVHLRQLAQQKYYAI